MALSKQVIFSAVAFAFLIAVTAVGLSNPKEFEGSRFGIFIKVLSSLAFILVALGLILTAQAFEEGQKLNKIAETFRLIDRSLMDQVKRMRELYPKCPRFVESLWPQSGLFSSTQYSDVEEDESCILDLCMFMMQSFEDHFTGSTFDNTGEIVWAGNYLQWASSDMFLEHFNILYPNFKQKTNDYARLLFEYARKGGKIKTGKDLEERSIAFTKDPRLPSIFEME